MTGTPELGGLTTQERKALDVIERSIAARRVAPSYTEIATALNIRAKSGVARIVAQLERKGRIRVAHGTSRGITLVAMSGGQPGYTLRPDLENRLQVYCRDNGETADAVLHDAVTLFLDAETSA